MNTTNRGYTTDLSEIVLGVDVETAALIDQLERAINAKINADGADGVVWQWRRGTRHRAVKAALREIKKINDPALRKRFIQSAIEVWK